ncbi:FadR/GntR family transcriptional regulator [Sciscionella marina]|uniref:FadR/GntR family transcriptional regulator n=1 Tax=Sciscionella marina TaxID=508770 RepID=UPI00035F68F5|nr:GntR family transcriptional regulator [Sciscionella marina]
MPPNQKEPQAKRVARLIIEDISSGKYAVGTRLPSERQLAVDFSVSRPVIREAISTIIGHGILEAQMGRGIFVTAEPGEGTPTEQTSLQDVINVREVLESGALRLSARRNNEASIKKVATILEQLGDAVAARADTAELDSALHTAIVEASGSATLASLWQNLQQQIDATIRISPHGHTMSTKIFTMHRTLAEGVTAGTLDEALTACEQLHEQNREFLRGLLG